MSDARLAGSGTTTRRRVLVLALGGTILMAQEAGGAGVRPNQSAAALTGGVALDDVDIETRSLMQVGSGSLSFAHLFELGETVRTAQGQGYAGIVVVQGTDTLEETSFALDLMVGTAVPLVFTGAMRANDQPGADGPANIRGAILTALSAAAVDAGVLVVMGDEIHAASLIAKTHSHAVQAFTSPGFGPLGYVREGTVQMTLRLAERGAPLGLFGARAPRVALHTVCLDDDGQMLSQLPGLGYAGLVLAGVGAGHVPAGMVPPLRGLARAMPVILCSRAPAGAALTRTYGYPGSEMDLIAAGLMPCLQLSAVKARILLTGLLELGADRSAVAARFALL